ncbi:Cation channel sperm-associated protein subunit beta [Hondaea fermentalgiana]|uniref:Cation channel sperm-associated protein subunit beta n=1 Tax=Hondaea fermentalgiana TaxID=2315210 RepID=A0A2R5GSJ2_9STRA|nr:Cation channel sperm-associated protein subunit beta [Hondaea fermentalgiana]|eukprot:GBG33847.1 Cation channel sperm-associated protein subunit beta [Hondaea fermentalgiana]
MVFGLHMQMAIAAQISGIYATAHKSSQRSSLHVDELVHWVVDTASSSVDVDELLFVSLFIGETLVGNATAINSENDGTLTSTFTQAGTFEVTAQLYSINGTLEDEFITEVHVEEKAQNCIEFYPVEGDTLVPSSTGTLRLAARFLRSAGETVMMGIEDDEITRELLSIGEAPIVRIRSEEALTVAGFLYNETFECWNEDDEVNEQCTRAQPVEGGWLIELQAKEWTGSAWLSVESSSHIALNGECGVLATKVPVIVSPLAKTFIGVTRNTSYAPMALSLPASRAVMHLTASLPCMPNVMATIDNDANVPGTITISYDAMRNFRAFDVGSIPAWTEGVYTSQQLCQVLECGNLAVMDLAFLADDTVLLTTTEGLVAVEFGAFGAQAHILPRTGSWRITAGTHCHGELSPSSTSVESHSLHRRVFLKQDSVAELLEVTTDELTGGKAFTFKNLQYLVEPFVSRDGHELLSAMYCTVEPRMVLMLYRSNSEPHINFVGTMCDGEATPMEKPMCYEELDDGSTVLKPNMGYVFPDGAELRGMCAHNTGLGVFAYGHSLWISFDGAHHFDPVLQLDDDEEIVGCPISSASKGAFLVQTTRGRVFFGKIHVKGLIPLYNSLGTDKLVQLSADNVPYWVRRSALGQVERFDVPIKLQFEVFSERADDFQWVISSLHGSRIAVGCIDTASGQLMDQCFRTQHEGMIVQPLQANIYDVDLSTGIAFAKTAAEVGETLSIDEQPCALQITASQALSSVCNKGETRPPLSVALSATEPGSSEENSCLASLTAGRTIFLSARQGSVTLALLSGVTNDTAGIAYCAFGEFPPTADASTQVLIGSSQWTTLASANLRLRFPSCPLPALQIYPSISSPSVRTLDKYDIFYWGGLIADQHAEKNRAVESVLGDNSFWMASGDEDLIRILRVRPSLTTAHVHHFIDPGFLPTAWSTKITSATFATYESVHPSEDFTTDFTSGTHSFLVLVEPSGVITSSVTTVLMSGTNVNLACDPNNFESVARLFIACPLTKDFLYVPGEDAEYIDLPVNYRPPSERGKGIPLSPNVYNADPSQPLYMNWYQVSRDSAQFGLCANASDHSDCDCARFDDLDDAKRGPEVSDCIVKVQRMLYSEYFVPSFVLGSEETRALNSTYQIRDVNGRQDFCTNASAYDTTECGVTSTIETFGFNPFEYDAILFVGEGLYHFEVSIQDPISFCDLKTYIHVYVEEPPLTPREESMTIAVTAVVLLVLGLFSYIVYSFWNRDHDQRDTRKLGARG